MLEELERSCDVPCLIGLVSRRTTLQTYACKTCTPGTLCPCSTTHQCLVLSVQFYTDQLGSKISVTKLKIHFIIIRLADTICNLPDFPMEVMITNLAVVLVLPSLALSSAAQTKMSTPKSLWCPQEEWH